MHWPLMENGKTHTKRQTFPHKKFTAINGEEKYVEMMNSDENLYLKGKRIQASLSHIKVRNIAL